jgi:hypothetical protein
MVNHIDIVDHNHDIDLKADNYYIVMGYSRIKFLSFQKKKYKNLI